MESTVQRRHRLTVVAVTAVAATAVGTLERAALRRWARQPDPRGDSSRALGPTTTEVVTTDGAHLRVVQWSAGTSPRIVLVHGFTASLEDWLPVVPHLLEAGLGVVALDLRGHGQSTLGADGVRTRRLADDLAEVLDSFDLRDAVLAGHSLGGYAVLALAVHRPETVRQRVARLVLVGATSTFRGVPELTALGSNTSPVSLGLQRHPRHGAVMMRAQVFGDSPSLPAIEDLRRRWSSCPLATRFAYARGLVGQTVEPGLAQVGVPVVVTRGSRDRVIPAFRSRAMHAALPDSKLVVLDGAGHATPTERPRELAEVLAGAAG